MRWITLLGRIGTVILMIGLALFLVSRIPTPTGYTGSSGSISPGEYQIEHSGVYLAQTGFQISVNSSDNISVYILGVSLVELDSWKTLLKETYPGSQVSTYYIVPMIFFHEAYPEQPLPDLFAPQTPSMLWAIAVLDKGLQTHPGIILWDPPPSSAFSYEFFPADVLDLTFIIANPSSNVAEIETEIRYSTGLVAKGNVILAIRLLISIGIALAIPWLILRKVKKSTF